jgi:hypothetical protein
MKNNKYLGILSVLTLTISLQSCEKFLDKEPISNFTDQSLNINTSDTTSYTKAEQAEALLASCYSQFRTEYFQLDYYVNGDMQSDNAYAGASGSEFVQFDNFEVDATNKNVTRDWTDLYTMVSHCNLALTYVPKITDPALTTTRKAQIIAEASFIRAWAYFDLTRLYGDVPLVLEAIPAINAANLEQIYPLLYPERVAQSKVYDQIITDLETALAGVPATAVNKGYITKGAVNTLLAKVYATRQPADWSKVKQYCDAVINGGYSLLPEFDYLWDENHENSNEAILEINYDGNWNAGTGCWGASMFIGTDWKKFNTPSNDLVKAYDDEGDVVRKNSSILFADVTGKWSDKYWSASAYPFINKYRDNQTGAQNMILLRLADVILLKAEAVNELGDVNAAATLVNQIRTRAKLGATPATDQTSMRLAIEKERRLELAFEGQRWFDLVRTGRATDVMNKVKDGKGNLLYFGKLKAFRYIWPVPQEELDRNQKLTQNQGY